MSPHNDVNAFHQALRSGRRVLALCGAGLPASSGLPTFRGPGGYWRSDEAAKLATPRAFRAATSACGPSPTPPTEPLLPWPRRTETSYG